MFLRYFHFLLLLAIFTACEKEPFSPTGPENALNFQAPVVGQVNYYLHYVGFCDELRATGDTLQLMVTAFDGDSLWLEESLTPGSPSYYAGDERRYSVKWSPQQLMIGIEQRQRSRLFFFYGDDKFRLTAEAERRLRQKECEVRDNSTIFRGDYIGRVDEFQCGPETYYRKRVVSCVPTILELDGYLVYDQHNLYASYTSHLSGCCGRPAEQMIEAYGLLME